MDLRIRASLPTVTHASMLRDLVALADMKRVLDERARNRRKDSRGVCCWTSIGPLHALGWQGYLCRQRRRMPTG
jgi:hypothetical protein